MKYIVAHFTKNTFVQPDKIRFISYVGHTTEVAVFVSDTLTWQTYDLIASRWQDFVTSHPEFQIEFREGNHTLEFFEGRFLRELF